jgi:DNA-binding NarL/FixJ family response regulator
MVQGVQRNVYRIKLALVDDHPILRQSLSTMLQARDDVDVIAEYSNGREAASGVPQCRPDVILMDVTMPHLNGIDATRLIKREFASVKVIIVSSYVDADQLRSAISAGATGYVSKLADIDELMLAIKTVHRGNTFYSGDILDQFDVRRFTEEAAGLEPQGSGDRLTIREREVLQLLAEGLTSKQIAAELFISPKTVEGHKARMMEKTKARNKSDLIRYALRAGITGDERPAARIAEAG